MPVASPREPLPLPPLELLEAELQRRSLPAFIRAAWPFINPQPYVHNWHIDVIGEHLMAVSRGEIRHLIINIPPRHMKSISVCVGWPSWVWAQRPDPKRPLLGAHVQFLYTSYSDRLSIRDSVKCRRVLQTHWYRKRFVADLPPEQQWLFTGDQNAKTRFENNLGGYRIATSVDGMATGEGGNIVVVDDPHNVTQALSDVQREGAIMWWDETMSTRLNDPQRDCFVIIMQRLHERDLTGHVLAANHPNWTHLCLPARYEPDHPYVYAKDQRTVAGEPLWKGRFGEAELNDLQARMGSYAAAGQLQQRPAPREGGIFKREWFNARVSAVPAYATAVRGWDLADTEESAKSPDPAYTASAKLYRHKGIYYLAHVTWKRTTNADAELLAYAKADGRDCTVAYPQDPGQAGKSQTRQLATVLDGYPLYHSPESGSKETRAQLWANQAEVGNFVLVETGDPVRDAWIPRFLDSTCSFPNAAHDDDVDAVSRAYEAHINIADARLVKPVAVPMMSPTAFAVG